MLGEVLSANQFNMGISSKVFDAQAIATSVPANRERSELAASGRPDKGEPPRLLKQTSFTP
ncbi:MAG: hypothetical protein Q8K43_08105, partial [Sulfurimicrobium sp.]|nr:hypothetical protein [Sulfurimicrobium sp.]